jgi:hypothetical protein
LTGFSTAWTFICSILKAYSAARMAVADAHFTVDVVCYCWCQFTVVRCCWCPLYRWCCVLMLMPVYRCVLMLMPVYRCVLLLKPTLPLVLCAIDDASFPLCAVADAHFFVVCCCWCPLNRCGLLLMPTLPLWAVADVPFTVVGCCWCPLYHCVLLLVLPPPPHCPPYTSFLYQHSQSVDVSRTQGSRAPEILFFWGGARTFVCMHRPLSINKGYFEATLVVMSSIWNCCESNFRERRDSFWFI